MLKWPQAHCVRMNHFPTPAKCILVVVFLDTSLHSKRVCDMEHRFRASMTAFYFFMMTTVKKLSLLTRLFICGGYVTWNMFSTLPSPDLTCSWYFLGETVAVLPMTIDSGLRRSNNLFLAMHVEADATSQTSPVSNQVVVPLMVLENNAQSVRLSANCLQMCLI